MAAGRIEAVIEENNLTFPLTIRVTCHFPALAEHIVVAQSAQEVVGLVENTIGLVKITTSEDVVIYPVHDGTRQLYMLRLQQGLIWSDCDNVVDYDLVFGN